MTTVRAVTNKGLQLIGEATGEDVLVFTKAYLSRETLTEEDIYALTRATGTSITSDVYAVNTDNGYIVTARFSSPDAQAATAILCGRLRSQDEDTEFPICVHSSDQPIGLSGSVGEVTFTLSFASDGTVDTDDDAPMSRGEIIAYINSVLRSSDLGAQNGFVMVDGTQDINGIKSFRNGLVTLSVSTGSQNADPRLRLDPSDNVAELSAGRIEDGDVKEGSSVVADDEGVTLHGDTITLDAPSTMITFKGQQRSLQGILLGLSDGDGNGASYGTLQGNFIVTPVNGGTSLRLADQTAQLPDDSLSGTCFLTCMGVSYAIVCIGMADVSEMMTRSNDFGTQTKHVCIINHSESPTKVMSVEIPFAWYDNKQSLMSEHGITTGDALPCFGNGTRCVCAAVVPMGDIRIESRDTKIEVAVSNAAGGIDGGTGQDIDAAINGLRRELSGDIAAAVGRAQLAQETALSAKQTADTASASVGYVSDRVTGIEQRVSDLEQASDSGIPPEMENRVTSLEGGFSRMRNQLDDMASSLSQMQEQIDALSQGGGNVPENIAQQISTLRGSVRSVQNDMTSIQSSYRETSLWGNSTFGVLLCAKEIDGNVSHTWIYTNTERVISAEFTPRVDFEQGSVSGAGMKMKLTYPFGIVKVGTKNFQLKNMPLAMEIEYELTTDEGVTECYSVFDLSATNSPTVLVDTILKPLIDIPWKLACVRISEGHHPYTNRNDGSMGYVKVYEGE